MNGRDLVLVLSLTCVANCGGARGTGGDSNLAWWETTCDAWGSGPDSAIGVVIRHFPVSTTTVDDETLTRSLEFDSRGVTVRLGVERFGITRENVKNVDVTVLGAHNSAVLLKITTNRGVLSDGTFGALELTCWRKVEGLLNEWGTVTITGSPPKLRIPVHDKDGNVIQE